MDKITYEISEMNNGVIIECIASVDKAQVCECKVSVDKSLWTISSWFTKPGYKGKGIGKNTMKTTLNHILKTYGIPEKIEYIWNGANSYVSTNGEYEKYLKEFDENKILHALLLFKNFLQKTTGLLISMS